MSTELSCEIVTARKRHQCSLCTAYIEPGEKCQREKFVDDGLFASFLTCQQCLDDNVTENADRMFGYDDGVDDEIAYEWACEVMAYGSGRDHSEVKAAQRYLDRRRAAYQHAGNQSMSGGAA